MTRGAPWTGLRWLLLALVALAAMVALRLLRATWRVRVEGEPPGGRTLVAFWHGDQIALMAASVRPRVLVSLSRDGEIGALAARSLGYQVARGSTSRGAVCGALGLARTLRGGGAAALAADGPRGPALQASASAGRLACMTGAALVPVGVCASRGWRLGSWDRMTIPAPFARVSVAWGDPVEGARLQHALEEARAEASAALHRRGPKKAGEERAVSETSR